MWVSQQGMYHSCVCADWLADLCCAVCLRRSRTGRIRYQFTRELALQREVEVEVETVDRGGTFLGTLRVLGSSEVCGTGCLRHARTGRRCYAQSNCAPPQLRGCAVLLHFMP